MWFLSGLRRAVWAGVLVSLLGLAACATPPKDPDALASWQEANDPLEPMNRDFFEFNRIFDAVLLRPVAEFYDAVLPQVVQDSVTNFLNNLRSPVILTNDLLQGEWSRANDTFSRFMINSIFGIGGLFDVAKHQFKPHDEDFGQTLAVWGVGAGPYVMLPILGPNPPREIVGRLVDLVIDPVTWLSFFMGGTVSDLSLGRTALTGVDLRARNAKLLEELERTSIDYYATVRSLYRQHRASEIRNGAPAPEDDTDDWGELDEEEEGEEGEN